MKYAGLQKHLANRIQSLKQSDLYKSEHVITSPQSTLVSTQTHKNLHNFSSCNYLGYCDDNRISEHAIGVVEKFGVGLSSVRFICGTTEHHLELEAALSKFFEKEDSILFGNGYSANMAVFETFFAKEDAIILAKRVHESLIESADLTRAMRYNFAPNDMEDLEKQLKKADKAGARFKLIAVDGLSATTGEVAPIAQICDLADKYDALVLVDECHSFGLLGEKGRGAAEAENALHRVDIITGTFGKAVSGCNGGFISGQKEIIEMLRQKGRPYLFSNTIPQFTAGTYTYALELIQQEPERRVTLQNNVHLFRERLAQVGIKASGHIDSPVVPILVGEESAAKRISEDLINDGIFALPQIYPYNPLGQARIRIQISSKHSEEELLSCLGSLQRAFRKFGIIHNK